MLERHRQSSVMFRGTRVPSPTWPPFNLTTDATRKGITHGGRLYCDTK